MEVRMKPQNNFILLSSARRASIMTMRILTIITLSLVVGSSFSQNFEGTLVWSIKLEITDPVAKARMEQAQKSMANPEAIREMQERMKDPQFQEMMKQNPELKQQMERAIKLMSSGDPMSIIPKGMVAKIKGDKSLFKIEGGMAEGEYLHKDGKSYRIDHEKKQFEEITPSETSAFDSVKIEKTKETANIKGYHCTKYNISYTNEGGAMTESVWYTTEIKGLSLNKLGHMSLGSKKEDFFWEIDGVPLKRELRMPEGVILFEFESIDKSGVTAALFELPAGYTEVK